MSKLQAGTQRVPESQRDSASKLQVVRGISASAAGYLELPVEIFANLKEEEVAPNDSSTWFDASSGSSASLIPNIPKCIARPTPSDGVCVGALATLLENLSLWNTSDGHKQQIS